MQLGTEFGSAYRAPRRTDNGEARRQQVLEGKVVQSGNELSRCQITRRTEDDETRWLRSTRKSQALAQWIRDRDGHVRPASARPRRAAWLDVAALLSLAAGYAGPLFTSRDPFGPAGRRRSLEERRDVDSTPLATSSRTLRHFFTA
jgi:hypothetical protein